MGSGAPVLECWFDFASTYSYVGAMRVEELCRKSGLTVAWKPFLLGPIFNSQLGIRDSPFNVQPIRGSYMWRDLERLCAKYQLPFRRPAIFPQNSVLAARVALVAVKDPWGGDFVRAVFQANFAEGKDISQPGVLQSVLERLEVPAEAVMAEATSEAMKPVLRAQTEAASKLGIFGAPNFVASGELFFGQDRLEDAVAWAQQHR